MYQMLFTSTLLFIGVGLADFLDGAVARAIDAQSPFGGIFDSLADAISFGVAPAILLVKSVLYPLHSLMGFILLFSAMIYTFCGVLRLARFQMDTTQKYSFVGMPIPSACGCVVSLNLFLHSKLSLLWFGKIEMMPMAIILCVSYCLIGFFMLSRWRFFSLKTMHVEVPSLGISFVGLILAIFCIYGLIYYFSFTLLVITWGYLLLGIGFSIYKRFTTLKKG